MKTLASLILATLVTLLPAFAGTITIQDSSMESLAATNSSPMLGGTSTLNIGGWHTTISGLLNLGGAITVGVNSNGPTPANGVRDLLISMPVSVLASADVSQTLATNFLPNSTYVLKVGLDQGTVLGLISGATIKLKAGNTVVATLDGTTLATLLDASAGFETVTLVYRTPNIAPAGNIGIDMSVAGLALVGGNIYVDDFSLTVDPISVTTSLKVTGNGFVQGTGGGAGAHATYQVVASADLNVPCSSWSCMATNQCDANGNYQFSVPVDPTKAVCYYRVRFP